MQAEKNRSIQTEIIKYIAKGHKQTDLAIMFGISQSAISRIVQKQKSGKPTPPNACSCCKTRKIAEGNRFLCSKCFQHESSPDELEVMLVER